MQKPMRNLECHAMAPYALGAAIRIAVAFLQWIPPVDAGAVKTS
jgi:hypothetical protein